MNGFENLHGQTPFVTATLMYCGVYNLFAAYSDNKNKKKKTKKLL